MLVSLGTILTVSSYLNLKGLIFTDNYYRPVLQLLLTTQRKGAVQKVILVRAFDCFVQILTYSYNLVICSY